MYKYLLVSILSALSWAICATIEKHHLLKYFQAHELYIIRSLVFLPFLSIVIYLISNKNTYKKAINMDTKTLILTTSTAILSFVGLYLFWYVLQNNDAVYSVSCIHPLFITFSILLSCLLYKEKINGQTGLGIIFVLLGIILINFKKNK